MKKINIREFLEENLKDCDISYRGGSLKIDIEGLLSQKSLEAIEEAGESTICGAYQNYLGGGITGSIQSARSFDINLLTESDQKLYRDEIAPECISLFYDQNNGGGDEYMQEESGQTLESIQNRPAAYPGL